MSPQPSSELTKTCKLCYKTRVLSAFAKKRDGLDSRCKPCKNRKRRELYRKHRRHATRPKHRITRIVEVVATDCPDVEDRWRALESILTDMALDILTESA